MADDAIRFQAQVFKVQTLVDGGLRVTLDLCMPYEDKTIVALFDAKQPGVILECAAVAVNSEKQERSGANGEIQAGRKRKSEWTPAEVQSVNGNT